MEKSGENLTFSSYVRRIFRTHTKAGGLMFIAAWSTLWLWFSIHIVKKKVEK